MVTIFIILLILFAVIISISWTIAWGAPWVPTSMKNVHKMLKLADLKPDELLYDLGCGDGRIIITAARYYGARAVGIELDPLRFLWSQLMITLLGLRERVRIIQGDLFNIDLSNADVVACYLLPDTNKKLEKKLMDELVPGTRVVSNTFVFKKVRMTKQDGKVRLYEFSPENTVENYIREQLISSKDN